MWEAHGAGGNQEACGTAGGKQETRGAAGGTRETEQETAAHGAAGTPDSRRLGQEDREE